MRRYSSLILHSVILAWRRYTSQIRRDCLSGSFPFPSIVERAQSGPQRSRARRFSGVAQRTLEGEDRSETITTGRKGGSISSSVAHYKARIPSISRFTRSQLAVIEQAVETASLMLGGQKARGYCLEMICADFLAGASLENPDLSTFSNLIRRLFDLLPAARNENCWEPCGNVREFNPPETPEGQAGLRFLPSTLPEGSRKR